MENILTSLAFSMYSNKGVYALFLGSGVSSAAGIPTGWKVIEDLICKIATIDGEDCGSKPAEWYKNKYHEQPDYSKLLDTLTLSSSERCNLLKPYFTPTDEEMEKGLKRPTRAHKAIAKLIKKEYIKVIVTTNFDRLLEQALQEENITPTVITSQDDVDGMFPLVHNQIMIFKINGDYMDTRFLNTDGELSVYPDKIKSLFLNILNDFGIISCGWSGVWDVAIKDIIRSSSNYRFGSYWTHLGTCNKELEKIAEQRKGKTLQIIGGDSFFTELYEKVEALANYENSSHPLSAVIVIERLKKYIVRKEYRIELHDLIKSEQERTFKNIQKCWADNANINSTAMMKPVIEKYVQHIDILLPLIINGSYWAEPMQYPLLLDVIKRTVEWPFIPDKMSTEYSRNIYYLPTLFLIYGMGISCVAQKKYDLMAKLFAMRNKQRTESYTLNIIARIHCNRILSVENARQVWGNTSYTPLNNYVYDTLRPFFYSLIPNDDEYSDYFDLFEFLCLLNIRHADKTWGKEAIILARFRWNGYNREEEHPINIFKQGAEKEKDNYLPIKSGLFNGSYLNYSEVVKADITGLY